MSGAIQWPRTLGRRRLYLDQDGFLANFDGAFDVKFGDGGWRNLTEDEMWAWIHAQEAFFRSLPPLEGAIEFFREIEHLVEGILTACPKSAYAHVATQKREWVYEHLSPDTRVIPVMGGRNKPLFMHAPGDILIDDFRKNIDAWRSAGGVGILHRDFTTTRAELARAIYLGVPA